MLKLIALLVLLCTPPIGWIILAAWIIMGKQKGDNMLIIGLIIGGFLGWEYHKRCEVQQNLKREFEMWKFEQKLKDSGE